MSRTTFLLVTAFAPLIAAATPNDIPDGDFELGVSNGSSYWIEVNSVSAGASMVVNRSGDHWGKLGGTNYNSDALEHPSVILDYDMSELVLTYEISSVEACGYNYDELYVSVYTPTDGWVQTVVELCSSPTGPQTLVLPATAYSGEDITIVLHAVTDYSNASTVWIDDVTTR